MTTRKRLMGRAVRGAGLVVVALSLSACQPPNPPLGVIDLVVEDGAFLALVDLGSRAEIHRSDDGGHTWSLMSESDSAGWADLWPTLDGETAACLAGDQCFRTEASPTPIWEASGAGEVPAWSFPAGRLEFVERYTLDSVYGAYSAAPRDIVADGGVVLVAMGNDGILRRSPDGQWNRGVLGDPKPFAMWGHNIEVERKFAFYFAVVIAAWATLATAHGVYRFSTSRGWRPPTFGPWLVLGWVSLLVAAVVSFVLLLSDPGFWEATFALFVPGAIAFIVTWDTMTPFLDPSPKWSLRVLRWVPLGIGVGCYLAFLAWSGGIISHHEVATGVAIVLVGAGLISLIRAQSSLKVTAASTQVTEPDAPVVIADQAGGTGSRGSPLRLTAMISLSLAAISVGFRVLARSARNEELFLVWLSVAVVALAGVLYLVAQRSGRPNPPGFATAGALASLVGGPAIGTMFALQPHHPRSTTPRILTYVLYIAMAGFVVSEVGGYALVAALILSPFTVPLADYWAGRAPNVRLSGELEP